MELDLDARLAAEAENRPEDHEITWRGRTWPVPAKVPWALGDLMASADVNGAMSLYLGAEQWAEMVDGATIDEVKVLYQGILEVSGIRPGESSASSTSSPSTGARSRRTSSASTGSTSGGKSPKKRSRSAGS